MRSCSAIVIAAVLAAAGGARAEGTGTIRGQVLYSGPRTKPAAHSIKIDARVCGAHEPILNQELIVAEHGELANVAVFLADAPPANATLPSDAGAVLKQENCVFSPHVQTVSEGTVLTIGNSDPVIHNVHATIDERTVFNLAMPLKNVSTKRKLDEAGIVSLRCDSGHTWMKAYIVILDHPFHATTDALGRFEIRDVPAGRYTLRAWHEKLGMTETRVSVESGSEADLKIDLGAQLQIEHKPVARPEDKPTAPSAPRGRTLYLHHCATCHGDKGDGAGEQAPFCSIPPRNFIRGEYKFRSTASGRLARVEDLGRTIAQGLRGTDMPPWSKTLGDEDIRLLAQYLTTLSPRYASEPPPPPIAAMSETPADAASIERGHTMYTKLQCAQCHGATGRGDGVSNDVAADLAYAPDLTRGVFKGGTGAPAVFRAAATGLSGSSMPSFRDLANDAELWDLAHYVDSLKESKSFWRWLFGDPAGRRSTP